MRGCFGNTILLVVQIFLSLVCSLLGLTAFIWYLFKYEDYQASIWGLFLAINALSVAHLHFLFLKTQIDVWYDKHTFANLMKFSALMSILALICVPIYIYYAIERNEELTLHGFHVDAILCILSLTWSINLFFSSRLYSKYVQLVAPGLLASMDNLNRTPYTFYPDTF